MEIKQNQEIKRITELIPLTKDIQNLDYYEIDNYCDALDENRNWCVGQIIERNNNIIKVHFEGWSPKHDICVNVASKKISQFRFYTVGYTGQKREAYRTQPFNEDQFNVLKDLLKLITESSLNNFNNAVQATQILRGFIFTNIDICLTKSLPTNSAKSIVLDIADSLYNYLDLSVEYFKFFKNNLFLLDLFVKNENLYLYDTKIAIIASLQEFVITLKRIFARDERTNKFYEVNIKLIIQENGELLKKIKLQIKEKIGLQKCYNLNTTLDNKILVISFIQYIDYFYSKGGFDIIFDIMTTNLEEYSFF